MSGYDLLFYEMPLPAARRGPETIFCTRAFDGAFNNLYRIKAPFEQVFVYADAIGTR